MKKPSIWFWVVGVLGVLWSLMGAFDYIMTRAENADYMAAFPPELVNYFYNMPMLLDVTWPIAVWVGFLGWLLILLRKRWAVPAFIVSFIAMIINFGYMAATGGLALQGDAMGPTAHIMTALVVIIGLFAIWFSRRERAKGTLR